MGVGEPPQKAQRHMPSATTLARWSWSCALGVCGQSALVHTAHVTPGKALRPHPDLMEEGDRRGPRDRDSERHREREKAEPERQKG